MATPPVFLQENPWTGAWQATVPWVTKSQTQVRGLSMHVRKHRHTRSPHWGKHSRSQRNVRVTGSPETSSPAPSLQIQRPRGGPAPRRREPLSSRVCAAPSFPPSLLVSIYSSSSSFLGRVNFHSGLLWGEEPVQVLSRFSLLSEKGKTFLDFLPF